MIESASELIDPALIAELRRLDALLALHLHRLRERGRSTLGDLVKGAVIEDGEAEGLLLALEAAHAIGSGTIPQEPSPATSALGPLDHAARVYGLSTFERDVLLLGLAIEIDGRYGRLMAYLNDHAERSRPTVALAAALLGGDAMPSVAPFLGNARLARFGLVALEGEGPLPSRALRLPDAFWPRLIGLRCPVPGAELRVGARDTLAGLLQPEATQVSLGAAVAWARERHEERLLLMVKGPEGSGRETLACAAGFALRGAALVVRPAALDEPDHAAMVWRETAWHAAALVVLASDAPDTRAPALLRELPAPVIWVGGASGSEALAAGAGRETIEILIDEPDAELRARFLARLLPAERLAADVDLRSIASRFRFGPGRLQAAARLALTRAGAFGASGQVTGDGLSEVCRSLPAVRLATLAQRLPCRHTRDDLIVPPETARELELAYAWARHRGTLFERWTDGSRMVAGRGLTCLFSGPPGTGKSLCAQVLAREMQLDVYRVDLSQVVSKYIGETEKNLGRVFDEAHAAGIVLFFDEADALFGKRTEVKDAHDRYANVETGFLLQRIEQHDGVCILATNLRRNMDDAFLRRMQVIAEFPMPGEAERRRIWQRHLPPPPMCGADIDLEHLATRFAVSGGEIRNAVVTAAFLAASEAGPLSMRHLALGLWRELRKGGRVLHSAEFGAWAHVVAAQANGAGLA